MCVSIKPQNDILLEIKIIVKGQFIWCLIFTAQLTKWKYVQTSENDIWWYYKIQMQIQIVKLW